MRLYLQQNNKTKDTQPDFKLVVPPETEDGEWVDIGAFWQAKSGNGFSGKFDETKVEVKLKDAPEQAETIEYPAEEDINPDDIPF